LILEQADMSKILVYLTQSREQLEQAEMALEVAKILVDEGHTVTMLFEENFLNMIYRNVIEAQTNPDHQKLAERYSALVAGGAKIELSGPPVQPKRRRGRHFKSLPGFAVPEALLRLSVGQDRIFTY
jgi:predicted peroxiredoxin